jgi:hypothetical protein
MRSGVQDLPLPSNREQFATQPARWQLLRDVAVFQLKLLLDALRDFVMSPLSLMAVAIDLLGRSAGTGTNFHRVLELGRTTDRWINLFGPPRSLHRPGRDEVTFDRFVAQVESLIRDEYERGGMPASAKEAIDRSLHMISRNRKP